MLCSTSNIFCAFRWRERRRNLVKDEWLRDGCGVRIFVLSSFLWLLVILKTHLKKNKNTITCQTKWYDSKPGGSSSDTVEHAGVVRPGGARLFWPAWVWFCHDTGVTLLIGFALLFKSRARRLSSSCHAHTCSTHQHLHFEHCFVRSFRKKNPVFCRYEAKATFPTRDPTTWRTWRRSEAGLKKWQTFQLRFKKKKKRCCELELQPARFVPTEPGMFSIPSGSEEFRFLKVLPDLRSFSLSDSTGRACVCVYKCVCWKRGSDGDWGASTQWQLSLH